MHELLIRQRDSGGDEYRSGIDDAIRLLVVVRQRSITIGDMLAAKARAMRIFDYWNEATGVLHKGTSYYREMESIIADAVDCGIQAAKGRYELLEGEPTSEEE